MALIYISIGSNIDREHYVRAGVRKLAEHFGALTLSSVYESEAVGFNGDPFYNLVVGVETTLSLTECVTLLKEIEDQFGRVRGAEKFCGRTLDLDLLTYDQLVQWSKNLKEKTGSPKFGFPAGPQGLKHRFVQGCPSVNFAATRLHELDQTF